MIAMALEKIDRGDVVVINVDLDTGYATITKAVPSETPLPQSRAGGQAMTRTLPELDRFLANRLLKKAADWNPSTDIAQAIGNGGPYTVVGKMRELKGLRLLIHERDDRIWGAEFYKWGIKPYTGVADHPATAICRAAELALEAKS